jgi:hypothetical protein
MRLEPALANPRVLVHVAREAERCPALADGAEKLVCLRAEFASGVEGEEFNLI